MDGGESYEINCTNDHRRRLSADELQELISSGEFECDDCGEALSIEPYNLECSVCQMTFSCDSLDDAAAILWQGCSHCVSEGGVTDSIFVPNSWDSCHFEYEWAKDPRSPEPLLRKRRNDYWEGLVHFCDAAQFASIYEHRRIIASETGYFKLPAVCLTEATIGNWSELQETHGDYGFVFSKRDILNIGGGPAIYIPQKIIKAQLRIGFSTDVKPFVNLLRLRNTSQRKYDYLHEREWRTPSDISFDACRPFGVVLGSDMARRTKAVLSAALEFGELSTNQGSADSLG